MCIPNLIIGDFCVNQQHKPDNQTIFSGDLKDLHVKVFTRNTFVPVISATRMNLQDLLSSNELRTGHSINIVNLYIVETRKKFLKFFTYSRSYDIDVQVQSIKKYEHQVRFFLYNPSDNTKILFNVMRKPSTSVSYIRFQQNGEEVKIPLSFVKFHLAHTDHPLSALYKFKIDILALLKEKCKNVIMKEEYE